MIMAAQVFSKDDFKADISLSGYDPYEPRLFHALSIMIKAEEINGKPSKYMYLSSGKRQ